MNLATLDDAALAAKLALEAGRLLTLVREQSGLAGKPLGDKGDSDANRFLSVYAEYVKAPEVTRKRMYLETMEQVLGGANKVIMDNSTSQGAIPYLPLNGLIPPPAPAVGGTN